MEGENQVGKTEREDGRGQGLGVVESDDSVIVESDVEVDVEVEGDSEVIEGDREREPQPGTSGLGVHGGGNENGTEGATRDMGLKRSAQGLNEGKEVTVGGGKRARLERAYNLESRSIEGDVSDDEMSEDWEGSGVESEQELDGEGDHGYHGDARSEGVRTDERKGGVWIVVGDSILRAKDMREGLQATVRADEVKVWGESGAKMRDRARLVEGQMENERKEGKKVEGIVLHVGTNDFGWGMNAAGMVMRAEQMAEGIEAIVGRVRLYWSVMLPRTKEGGDQGHRLLMRECNFRVGSLLAQRGWAIVAHVDIWKREELWGEWLVDGLHLGREGVTKFVLRGGRLLTTVEGLE